MFTENLLEQISEKYNIGPVIACELIHDGIDNMIYKLSSDSLNKKFVARVSKRSGEHKSFDFEFELLRYLTYANFSIPKLIVSKSGNNSTYIDGVTCVVFEYIDGDVFHSANEELLRKGYIEIGGRLLGELHISTEIFQPDHVPKRTIFTEIERLKNCSKEDLGRFEGYQELVAHVDTFTKEAKKRMRAGLPGGIIHNDYHIGNLIYAKDGSVAYMLDFDWACAGPFIKDIGFAIGAWSCGDIRKELPDTNRINTFLAGYNATAPHKINYDSDLLFWICFAYISEACTFFPDVLEGHYPNLNIIKVDQCLSYRKFLYFLNKYTTNKKFN